MPRRSHDPIEIEFRRQQAGTGALMHQLEQRAINIAVDVLESIEDPHERALFAKLVGGAFLGSADYIFETGASDVRMRHNLALPMVAEEEGVVHSPESYRRKVHQDIVEAARLSLELATLKREKQPLGNIPMRVARAHGRAGLSLSLYPLPRIGESSRPVDVQDMVFETAIDLRSAAVATSKQIGTRISIAQLADRVSPLGVHILRTMPDSVAGSFEETVDQAA